MRSKLRENEHVIFETRKHWIMLSWPFIAVVASVIFLFLARGLEFPEAAQGPENFIKKLSVFAIFGSLGYLIYSWYDRRFNLWSITNLRIIDEWGVLSHNAKESPLNKVNNVSYRQTIIGMILNYGTVEIQTAAEQGATLSTYVMFPKEFCKAVVDAQESYQKGEKEGVNQKEKIDNENRIECPYCAEWIKVNAKICRYCNREILTEDIKSRHSTVPKYPQFPPRV